MVINNREIDKYSTFKEKGGFHQSHYICPTCFRHIQISTSVESINIKVDPISIGDDGEDINMVISGPNYNIMCEKCGDIMFDCDEKLVGSIIQMNKKGYTTQFCCEGHHIYRDQYNHLGPNETCIGPYVKFYVPLFKKGALAVTKAIAADVYTTMFKSFEKAIDVELSEEVISYEVEETVSSADGKDFYKSVTLRVSNNIMLQFFDPDLAVSDAKNYAIFKKLQIIFTQFMQTFANKLPDLTPLHFEEEK